MIGAESRAFARARRGAGRLLEDVDVAARHERGAGRRLAGTAARLRRRRRHREAAGHAGVFRQRLVGIAVLDRVEDVGPRRDDLLDPVAGLELEILHEAEEQRIRHRDRQQVLFELDRDADALERDVFRDEDDRGRVGRLVAEADVGKAELVGERLGDLFFGREVEADEDRTDAFAGLLVLRERDLEIVLRDQPRLNQTFPDFLAHSVLLATRCAARDLRSIPRALQLTIIKAITYRPAAFDPQQTSP